MSMYIECTFNSWSLYHSVSAGVIIPTDVRARESRTHASGKKLPVLYLLHDKEGDYTSWQRYTAVERYADEWGVIVVMPNCLDGRYRNVSVSFSGMPMEGDKYENYEAFFTHELKDWTTANFPASDKASDSFIVGCSEGGYGALQYALSSGADYAAAGLFLPKIYDENGELYPELCELWGRNEKTAPDIYLLADGERGLSLPHIKLGSRGVGKWQRCDCGISDFLSAVISKNGGQGK